MVFLFARIFLLRTLSLSKLFLCQRCCLKLQSFLLPSSAFSFSTAMEVLFSFNLLKFWNLFQVDGGNLGWFLYQCCTFGGTSTNKFLCWFLTFIENSSSFVFVFALIISLENKFSMFFLFNQYHTIALFKIHKINYWFSICNKMVYFLPVLWMLNMTEAL